MIEVGAVAVDDAGKDLSQRFSANLRPMSDRFLPEALAITGFEDPRKVMVDFAEWVSRVDGSTPRFMADNNGFDWMFTCWSQGG